MGNLPRLWPHKVAARPRKFRCQKGHEFNKITSLVSYSCPRCHGEWKHKTFPAYEVEETDSGERIGFNGE